MQWYKKGAEQGFVAAQYFLGNMYAQGKGVAQSDADAAKWYEMAAMQKLSEKIPAQALAQYKLAEMYVQGVGVEQNVDKAKEWAEKACQNDERKACELYENLK